MANEQPEKPRSGSRVGPSVSEMCDRVDAVEQVLLAERGWLLAHLQLDVDALERLTDPDYLQIDAVGGTVDKEQLLASFRSGERYWAEASSDEHHVRVYGDAAVVVGRWRAKGKNGPHPFDYEARYVSVWVRRDEGWRMVSDQSTPLA